MIIKNCFALLWSLLLEEIFSRESRPVRRKELKSPNRKFGKLLFIWLKGLKNFMIEKCCIVILNAQMCSLQAKAFINSEIWMFLKFWKWIWHTLKLELPIMLALKFGRINLMEPRVICGLWVASYIRWQLWGLLLLLSICKVYIVKLSLVIFKEFPWVILTNLRMWLDLF